VSWRPGSNVWYGAAFFLPTNLYRRLQGWMDILRWDNWGLAQSTQDQGGVTLTHDTRRLLVQRRNVPAAESVTLIDVAAPSLGTWHWLEVHQRFSRTPELALTELWVDGARVGSSTVGNINGRPITALRVGIVATNDRMQRNPLQVWFDRVSISARMVGP
jgi:hypothetical protein